LQSDPSPEEFLQLACKRVGGRLREARISIAVGGIAVPFTDLSSRGSRDLFDSFRRLPNSLPGALTSLTLIA